MADEKPIAPEDPRVRMAAERTLLAWVRTGLALMGFGFVVARFGLFLRMLAGREDLSTQGGGFSLALGIALVLLGVTVTLAAARQHAHILERLRRGEALVVPRWSLGIVVSLVLGILGVTMAIYLVTVGY